MGGIRLGFEQAFKAAGFTTQCVLTSEIKPAAIKALTTNFGPHAIRGDITTVDCREIEDFDFSYQPSINKNEILELNTLGFIERCENVLFTGPSGVGKTHLAVALGITAAKKRYSVYFIS